jgi:adhesin transport system outer membrane protein
LDKCPNTPSGYKVDENGCVLRISLKINFANNSSEIEQSAMKELNEFAKFLLDNPKFNTTITGHTSIAGNESPTYNKWLSQKRAQKIKDALVKLGVKESRITAIGKGASEPIASNDTEEGRAQNRRIEASFSQDSKSTKEKVPSGWSL